MKPLLSQTKTLKVSFEKALKACGDESLIETLYNLQDAKVILGFEIDISIKVDRDKATSIENFFLLQQPLPGIPKKKKRTAE